VQNTLAEIGVAYQLIDDAEGIRQATKIILPGVGHFGQMMRALDAMRIRGVMLDRIAAGTPFLGICLGLQALFSGSEEAPELPGFGLFEGMVKRFEPGARVPHMGWNEIVPLRETALLENVGEHPYVYFAHSYYAPVVDATAAVCEYTTRYTAVLEHKNIYGVQFHPEKSGPLGLCVVRNFVEL
jgi:imidazole glycerol phosphate synthase glutamine amidotransferase subunit